MDVKDKTLLITGASQGLGRFLALHFARRGAHLVLCARNRTALEETTAQVRDVGGRSTVYAADLTRLETLEAMAADLRARAIAVDVLINNAADVTSKPFLDTSLDEIDQIIRTNVSGALQLTRLVVPLMLERELGQGGPARERCAGMIVNISSLAGYKPNPSQTVYSISKGGVNAMSEALAAELAPKGIRVMNVALSSVGPSPSQVACEVFAERLERAIREETPELFLSMRSKWLMRLYWFLPALSRWR